MSGRQEIEVKFALQDPAEMREVLHRAGFESVSKRYELNIRLDDARHSLSSRLHVLRLRKSETDQSTTWQLTFKLPAERKESGISIRQEHELEVSDGTEMLSILALLGYEPYWRYEKNREIYHRNELEVVLDETPIGWFIEIEGPEAAVQNLIPVLGFDHRNVLQLSYEEIFENVRRALDLDVADMLFESFIKIDVPLESYCAD